MCRMMIGRHGKEALDELPCIQRSAFYLNELYKDGLTISRHPLFQLIGCFMLSVVSRATQ